MYLVGYQVANAVKTEIWCFLKNQRVKILSWNFLYESWPDLLYQNHFCPGMKLVEKQRINSKYKKRYDAPKTPYQRLLDSAHTDEATINRLRNVHKGLNPFVILKQGIEKKLKRIFRQIKVTSNVRQRI